MKLRYFMQCNHRYTFRFAEVFWSVDFAKFFQKLTEARRKKIEFSIEMVPLVNVIKSVENFGLVILLDKSFMENFIFCTVVAV